jgi:hypothetical protein
MNKRLHWLAEVADPGSPDPSFAFSPSGGSAISGLSEVVDGADGATPFAPGTARATRRVGKQLVFVVFIFRLGTKRWVHANQSRHQILALDNR